MKFTMALVVLYGTVSTTSALPIDMMAGAAGVDKIDSPRGIDLTLIGDGYRRRSDDRPRNMFEGASTDKVDDPEKVDISQIGDGYRRRSDDHPRNMFEGASTDKVDDPGKVDISQIGDGYRL